MQILLLLFREVYYFLPYNVDNNNLSVDFNNNNNKINDNSYINNYNIKYFNENKENIYYGNFF